jgi:hypothetical protein
MFVGFGPLKVWIEGKLNDDQLYAILSLGAMRIARFTESSLLLPASFKSEEDLSLLSANAFRLLFLEIRIFLLLDCSEGCISTYFGLGTQQKTTNHIIDKYLLRSLQIEYPRSVHLIRGNHEAADINALFGFRIECIERMVSINLSSLSNILPSAEICHVF